jgi:carboxyl-terminal processing protease
LDLFKSVRSTTADVNEELEKLERAGARGLVLDLRGNGGGSLLEALMLSSVFMDAGAVAQIQDDDDDDKPMELSGLPGIAGGGSYTRPMVVLIDRGSASASELVSGVLQDRGRAVILGDRQTHGKGSMQEVIQLGKRRGGALVTRGVFYRVTGSSTQVKGVASDIRLPSVLDGITKLGENNLPNALPWTKVAAVKYEKAGDVQRCVPELARRSAARQATNTVFQAHLEKVRGVAEACNRKSLPLDYAAFKAQKRRDLQCGVDKVGFNGLDVDVVPDADACDKNGLPKRGKDVVLDEALNILADLVELSGGSGKGK